MQDNKLETCWSVGRIPDKKFNSNVDVQHSAINVYMLAATCIAHCYCKASLSILVLCFVELCLPGLLPTAGAST